MALRFRRSIKIMPGLRVNIGKSGFSSLSVGPRGFTTSVGAKGIYQNIGLPGTGLSFRSKLSGGGARSSGLTKKQQKELIIADLESKVENLNEILDEGINQHRKIRPLPNDYSFSAWLGKPEKPKKPRFFGSIGRGVLIVLGFLMLMAGLFSNPNASDNPGSAGSVIILGLIFLAYPVAKYTIQRLKWKPTLKKWEEACAEIDEANRNNEARHNDMINGDVEAIVDHLEGLFDQLDWFLETLVSFEVSSDGEALAIDVDLPEIEDIPEETVYIKKTTASVEKKQRKEADIRKDYLVHVHAIALRLAGEVYCQLPTIKKVMVSGYTQRLNTATGKIQDDYVYSIIFDKATWRNLEPANTDPVDCFNCFPCRRSIQRNKIMNSVDPFTWEDIR